MPSAVNDCQHDFFLAKCLVARSLVSKSATVYSGHVHTLTRALPVFRPELRLR